MGEWVANNRHEGTKAQKYEAFSGGAPIRVVGRTSRITASGGRPLEVGILDWRRLQRLAAGLRTARYCPAMPSPALHRKCVLLGDHFVPVRDRFALHELGFDLGRLGVMGSELDPELAHHSRGPSLTV